jgi:hypothetical protein
MECPEDEWEAAGWVPVIPIPLHDVLICAQTVRYHQAYVALDVQRPIIWGILR